MKKQIYYVVILVLISTFTLNAIKVRTRGISDLPSRHITIINNIKEPVGIQTFTGKTKRIKKGYNSIKINNKLKTFTGTFIIQVSENLNYLKFDFSENFRKDVIGGNDVFDEAISIETADKDSWPTQFDEIAISKQTINRKKHMVSIAPSSSDSTDCATITIDYDEALYSRPKLNLTIGY